MKQKIEIVKFSGLVAIAVFLFSFSNKRNGKRPISHVNIEFLDTNSPFISYETVNKLLIQKPDTLQDLTIETLDLVSMEERLNTNSMIRHAEVYVTSNGILGALIEQRDPIGRVRNQKEDYYIDADGRIMPLSEEYSARVPLVSGIEEEDVEYITPLLLEVRADEFMRKLVIGIHKNTNDELELLLRNSDLKTIFGKPVDIDKKFQNFKTFYKKTITDSTINRYNKVDLKFGRQVIATKK